MERYLQASARAKWQARHGGISQQLVLRAGGRVFSDGKTDEQIVF
jgi:hypothetical protein